LEPPDRLRRYADLLSKWNPRINLVGQGTLRDVWRRHMLDSAQLHSLIADPAAPLVDLGSGAGARAMGAAVTIHAERIEDVTPFVAGTIVSRALAPLPDLLDLAVKFTNKHSILLFLKGRTVDQELTGAEKEWSMRVDRIPSRTDPYGTILRLEAISRALHATPED
jgi:16S rRNA (guanine527-N7)-methyltransferase